MYEGEEIRFRNKILNGACPACTPTVLTSFRAAGGPRPATHSKFCSESE